MNQGEFYVYSPDGGFDGLDTIKVVGGRFTYEVPNARTLLPLWLYSLTSLSSLSSQSLANLSISKADASHLKEMEVKGTKAQ